jgi:hypothetical protein
MSNPESVAAAGRMTDSMDKLAERFRALDARQERSRSVIRWIIWSVVAHVALTIGFVILSFIAVSASHEAGRSSAATAAQAAANTATLASSCATSNVTRADDIVLWTHLLSLVPPKTPAQQATDTALIAFVHKTFAPQVCPK